MKMKKLIALVVSVFILIGLSSTIFAQTETVEVTQVSESLGHEVVDLDELVVLLNGSVEENDEGMIYTLNEREIEVLFDTPIILVDGEQETFLTDESSTGEVLPQWGYEITSTDTTVLVPVQFVERVLDIEIEEQVWE